MFSSLGWNEPLWNIKLDALVPIPVHNTWITTWCLCEQAEMQLVHRGFMLNASICMCCFNEQTTQESKNPVLWLVLIMVDIDRMLNLGHFFLFLPWGSRDLVSWLVCLFVCLFVWNDKPPTFACYLWFGKIKVDFIFTNFVHNSNFWRILCPCKQEHKRCSPWWQFSPGWNGFE